MQWPQEQFEEKVCAVFRPELRQNKELERFAVSMETVKRSRRTPKLNALA
jgi:hypothetical protein